MDAPDLAAAPHRNALRGLAAVNRASFAARSMLRAVLRLSPRGPIRVLDVACGGGDLTLALGAIARRQGRSFVVDGFDRSAIAVAHAREAARRRGAPTRFFRADALLSPLPGGYDVVVTALFLHHLAPTEVVALLGRMADAARIGIVVSDLERTVPGYLAAWAGTRLLTRSPIVHVDGPRSVRAAFRVGELRLLARSARLRGIRIRRTWPFRMVLTGRRP